jgi:murein DD-endopeptidase MepM/ murein hydrolase activator NlpD
MIFNPAPLVATLFASTAMVSLMATPVLAASTLSIDVQPAKPILGDTIAVVIQADSTLSQAPTVQVNAKSWPAFAIPGNRWRAFIPTTPLEKAGRRSLVVSAGAETRNLLLWVNNRQFPVQKIWLPPGKDKEGSDWEFDRVDAFKALVSPQKFWQGTLRRPNAGSITTGYGVRRYYNGDFAEDYYHRGLDYAGASGSAVVAAAAGRVALVGRESQGFSIHGNVVGLDHGQGVLTIYLHLSQIKVKPGEMVQAGQVIGSVGSTGAATGPHLHWGLYVSGQSVDPRPWFTRSWE